MIRRRWGPISIVALALLTACAGFKQPEVRVEGMRLGALGLQGGTLLVQLFVRNPNGYELRTSKLGYHIELRDVTSGQERWIDFAAGDYVGDVRVAAHDSSVVQVPVQFTYAGAGSVVRQVLQTGSFEYRISGDVAVERPVSRSVPFRRTGTVVVGS